MQQVDLLLVGDATDGPVEEFIPVESLDEALRLFGGYQFQTTTVTSGQTTFTLNTSPWGGEVIPMARDSDGFLVPTRLFEMQVSGSVVSWNPLGEAKEITFRSLVQPGATSLLRGLLATRRVDLRPHVVRLGGTIAEAASGNFSFYSRSAGSRYNGITVVVGAGTVLVSSSGGVGRTTSYQPANDRELAELLEDDAARGYGGVLLTGPFSPSSFTIPNGTYILTGGTDGALTVDALTDLIVEHDLEGVEILCPVGLNTQQVSGAVIELALNNYPTLMVAQAPITGPALSGIAHSSRFLASVGFQTTLDSGTSKERVEDAAPLVAAILGTGRFGLTLAALPEFPPSPRYSQAELHLLSASGHILPFRSISKDWSLWHVNTGDPGWPVSTFRALQEIVRIVFETTEVVLGSILVDTTDLETILDERFARAEGSRVVDYTLELAGEILYVEVSFIPSGEVRVITAQVKLGSRESEVPI